MQFTGTPILVLRVIMWNPAPFTEVLTGEVLELAKPPAQDDAEFLAAVITFHEKVMCQQHEFFTIAGHCIRPDAVERIELVATYVNPDEKRF